MLYNSSSPLSPSCPDIAPTSMPPTSDPSALYDFSSPIPTIITTPSFNFFHYSTMSILHWYIRCFRSNKNDHHHLCFFQVWYTNLHHRIPSSWTLFYSCQLHSWLYWWLWIPLWFWFCRSLMNPDPTFDRTTLT